jgi:hypothetical protein
MTLTASTGSFGKHEMRVCDDGLGALALAADGLRSCSADAALVTSWSKLSEGDLRITDPWGIEPAFHRPLGLTSSHVAALQRSEWRGETTIAENFSLTGGDVAVSLILTKPDEGSQRHRSFLGAGWSSGPYLRTTGSPLYPVTEAASRAVADAGLEMDSIEAVHVGGFFDISDDEIREAIGAPSPLNRSEHSLELGYATGLVAVLDALEGPGPRLVISRAGVGTSRAYAAVVSVSS